MSDRYSKQALLEFLKQAGMNGLMNPATARSRRTAAESLLTETNSRETNDLRELKLDELCSRFHKLPGSTLRPEVVDLYRRRLDSALSDFFSWCDNPDGFQSSAGEALALRSRKDRHSKRSTEELANEQIELSKTDQAANLLPIPIRPDKVVYVQNLPLDLTPSEAAKIAAVINAMSTLPDDQQ